MLNDERPYFDITPDGKTIINDPRLKEFYREGFRLAVNFLYQIIPAEGQTTMNQENFLEHVNDMLQDIQIEPDFFVKFPIITGTEGYPDGLCPGPGGSCIDCPDGIFGR